MSKEWLKIEEVAEYYQTTPKTVRKWLYERKLRFYKVGGLVRIHKKDVENFPVPKPSMKEITETEDQ